MLLKDYFRQTFICLLLTGLVVTTGCSSWEVQLGETVVPAIKNCKLALYPSGITWNQSKPRPGIWLTISYHPAPKVPSKVFVEFDDEFGKHHSLAASCSVPWYFTGTILVLVTRKENLGKTGDGCVAVLQAEGEENYDEDYLLKVYLGDNQDFSYDKFNKNKFVYSLQRDDEYSKSNVIFLVRDIPEEYEIKQDLDIVRIEEYSDMPITSENGMRAKQGKKQVSSIYQGSKGELFWRRNDISISALRYIDVKVSSNGVEIINFRTENLGLPYNFRGDVVVLLTRDGDSYQLRIFVDDIGALVAYKDYRSLCQALDERYASFTKKDVRRAFGLSESDKDREGYGMCHLIDCRKQ